MTVRPARPKEKLTLQGFGHPELRNVKLYHGTTTDEPNVADQRMQNKYNDPSFAGDGGFSDLLLLCTRV